MKTPIPFLRTVALLAVFTLGFTAVAPAQATTKVADLQVQIDVPPSWRPFLDDDIADALARILRENFSRRGFKGVIDHVTAPRAANPDLPLLSLRLLEWRITRTGQAECTLTASLRPASAAEEIDLGLITHSQFTWIRERGRFGLARIHETADALEDSASGAMRDLFPRVAATGAVRGMEVPRK